MKVTILNARLVTAQSQRHGPLHIADGRLVEATPPGARTLDLRDHLIFPGLINAHEHLPLNGVPSLPAHPPFSNSYEWIKAFQPYFSAPAIKAALAVPEHQRQRQGGLKNLLSGVTTVLHHDPWDAKFTTAGFPVRVAQSFGWSHSLGLGLQIADCAICNLQSAICNLQSAMPHYGPPLPASYQATPPDLPWIIHLAEGTDDLARSELGLLDELGCLGPNTLLVHGVGLDQPGLERLVSAGAGLVWCPASNLRLLGRTLAPAALAYLAAHGRLTLGSDSRISGAFDLLAELRVAATHSDLAPATLLRLVTTDAARLLRLSDVGGLTAGMRADLLILPDAGGDPYAALLAAERADLRAVLRDGRPVIADPDLANWFAILGVEAIAATLDGRAKLVDSRLAPFTGLEEGFG